jgi:dynein heavy chain
LALKQKLEEDMIKTNNRLISAEKLTVLLEEEGIRWKEQIETIGEELLRLIGDVFLSAATISYLGPFTGAYREPVLNAWK